jgi:hypothetical protein
LDYTFLAIRKLERKWSAPRRIIGQTKNSYKLETLEGLPIGGRFIPRYGTSPQEAQRAVEEALGLAEEEADVEGGIEDVDVAEEIEKVDVGEKVDGIDDLISEDGSAEEGGPEERAGDDENGDDREDASGAQRVEQDEDKVSEEVIASDVVPVKGPRRSKRLRNLLQLLQLVICLCTWKN